jgi:hypothetical protein
VCVRLKNKGAKRNQVVHAKKYQAPVPKHPETENLVNDKDIHANHVEAFNASLRRRNSVFVARRIPYANQQQLLQRTFDVFLASPATFIPPLISPLKIVPGCEARCYGCWAFFGRSYFLSGYVFNWLQIYFFVSQFDGTSTLNRRSPTISISKS